MHPGPARRRSNATILAIALLIALSTSMPIAVAAQDTGGTTGDECAEAPEGNASVACQGLKLAKTADADFIDAGDVVGFTLHLWNEGPGIASNVDLHDELPAGMAWDFEIMSDGMTDIGCLAGSSLEDGGVLRMSLDCEIATLGVTDMSGGVVIRVFAATDRTMCGPLANEAIADGAGPQEPIAASDSVLVRCPTVTLTKQNDAVGAVLPGGAVGYTLTLSVRDGPAESVTVRDTLPDGLAGPADISHGGVPDAAGDVVTWNLADLADGDYVLTYTALVASDADDGEALANIAVVTSTNSQCPDLETLGPECQASSTISVAPLVIQPPPLGGNPTPTPLTPLPNTAMDSGRASDAITVPLVVVVFLFAGSFGTAALAHVKAPIRRPSRQPRDRPGSP